MRRRDSTQQMASTTHPKSAPPMMATPTSRSDSTRNLGIATANAPSTAPPPSPPTSMLRIGLPGAVTPAPAPATAPTSIHPKRNDGAYKSYPAAHRNVAVAPITDQ